MSYLVRYTLHLFKDTRIVKLSYIPSDNKTKSFFVFCQLALNSKDFYVVTEGDYCLLRYKNTAVPTFVAGGSDSVIRSLPGSLYVAKRNEKSISEDQWLLGFDPYTREVFRNYRGERSPMGNFIFDNPDSYMRLFTFYQVIIDYLPFLYILKDRERVK